MCCCRKSIYPAYFQHQNHTQDRTYAGQRLQQIRLHAHLHNRFQPLLRRLDLGFQEIESHQLLFDSFTAVLGQFMQPGAELLASSDTEEIRSWYLYVETRQRTVDAILNSRAQSHQEDAEPE